MAVARMTDAEVQEHQARLLLRTTGAVPARPVAPVATAGPAKGQATIAFTPPASSDGGIDYYRIQSPAGPSVIATASPAVLSGLQAGAQNFNVQAHSVYGFSQASPNSNIVTVT